MTIPTFLRRWYHKWKELLGDRKYLTSFLAGIAVLIIAFLLNHQVLLYTNEVNVLSVGDLILDRIPTINLSYMYTFGIYLTMIIVTLYPLIFKPEIAPFTGKTVGAFILIRSFFISLTHLGVPANYFHLPQLTDNPSFFSIFYLNDLFFSGHTGFPFLGALLFWENKYLRYFLIAMSIGQAITVLFMHVHYSIDVFSAWFITYTIYILSDRIFNKLNLSFKRIAERFEMRMRLMSKRGT